MAHIVILGAGIGGLPAAYELRHELGKDHRITVVSERSYFQFVPSNPWVAIGKRTREDITFDIQQYLQRHSIDFIAARCETLDAENNLLHLEGDQTIQYDYLIIATGPSLAFDEVKGSGPDKGYSMSIYSIEHAEKTWINYQSLLDKGHGNIVIGAMPFSSSFISAYEFAFIVDADLRKRKIRDKYHMTLLTPEPYIGHLGLAGVGNSNEMLESELRSHHINWITNAKTTKVDKGLVYIEELDDKGEVLDYHELEFDMAMLLPAFKGVDTVSRVEGLCDSRGFVEVDAYLRSPKYQTIYSVGLCTATPLVEETPVPTAAPRTGYMIETMVTTVVRNIASSIKGNPPEAASAWNTICFADMGDTGAVFVALPQMPPRDAAWFKKGKWVHIAKIAFEKYFIRNMKKGNAEPIYEKYILKMLGIRHLKK